MTIGLGNSSVIEHWLHMHETLGSIPTPKKKKQK
jgi:hypothetical protein